MTKYPALMLAKGLYRNMRHKPFPRQTKRYILVGPLPDASGSYRKFLNSMSRHTLDVFYGPLLAAAVLRELKDADSK